MKARLISLRSPPRQSDSQTTATKPFRSDGTVHEWALTYDPRANGGDGEVVFTLDGKEHRAPLDPGHKQDGAVFDR